MCLSKLVLRVSLEKFTRFECSLGRLRGLTGPLASDVFDLLLLEHHHSSLKTSVKEAALLSTTHIKRWMDGQLPGQVGNYTRNECSLRF